MDTKLITIDYGGDRKHRRFIKDAINTATLDVLSEFLSLVHGELEEVIFIPKEALTYNSILVYNSGTLLLVGTNTNLDFFTYGYQGSGPERFSKFLSYEGFLGSYKSLIFNILSKIEKPLILKRDGSIIKGEFSGESLIWEDDREFNLSDFNAITEKLENKSERPWWRFW